MRKVLFWVFCGMSLFFQVFSSRGSCGRKVMGTSLPELERGRRRYFGKSGDYVRLEPSYDGNTKSIRLNCFESNINLYELKIILKQEGNIIKTLNLSGCIFLGSDIDLSDCSNLEELNISFTRISLTGLEAISNQFGGKNNITLLNLAYCSNIKIIDLSLWPQLKTLIISWNMIFPEDLEILYEAAEGRGIRVDVLTPCSFSES